MREAEQAWQLRQRRRNTTGDCWMLAIGGVANGVPQMMQAERDGESFGSGRCAERW
jgi:hypothetical protein